MTAVLRGRKHGGHSNLTKLASSWCCELLLAAASQQCVAAVKITSFHSHAHSDAYEMKRTALWIYRTEISVKQTPSTWDSPCESVNPEPIPLKLGVRLDDYADFAGQSHRIQTEVSAETHPHIDGPSISSEKKKPQ